VKRYIDPDKQKVIALFEKSLQPKFGLILPFSSLTEPIYYTLHIRSSKSILGFFSYYLQKFFGGNERKAIYSSLAVEALSAITLALDDIIDNDETRCGVPTTWKKYGLRHTLVSILVAQEIIFNKCKKIDEDIFQRLHNAWERTLKFFILEKEYFIKKPSINKLENLANLFTSFSNSIIDILKINSKLSNKTLKHLREFNKELSLAWYFSNALEVFSENKSKKTHSDIINKYYTFPIVILLNKLNGRDKKIFESAFGNYKNIGLVVSLLKKYNVKSECMRIITFHYQKALKHLKLFWNTVEKVDNTLKLIFRVYSHLPLVNLKCEFLY
jgi:geranylgeranyl pyrophosphate synthase